MKQHDIDVGGCKVHVREHGSGPAIVFGHSLSFDGDMWEAQVDALSSRYRTITIDFRGHGRSEFTPNFTLEDCAEDVAKVMTALGVERAGYCGLSMGGMTGMRLALKYPQRIAALVLMNTSAEAEEPAKRTMYEMFNEHARGKQGDAQSTAMVMGIMFSQAFLGANPSVAAKYQAKLLERPADDGRYFGGKAVLSRSDVLPQISAIKIPTLVISSKGDNALPPSPHGEKIAAAIAGSKFEILEGGHMSAVEQAGKVTKLLADHFDQHLGAAK
ncbi:MAG: alpha/beta fold hydrolase [Kofleriaceae bacterium]